MGVSLLRSHLRGHGEIDKTKAGEGEYLKYGTFNYVLYVIDFGKFLHRFL